MLRARPTSSTTVSGQTSFMSSAFSTTRPRRSSRTCKVSMALGTSGTISPSRNRRRCSVSYRNGPKWWITLEPAGLTLGEHQAHGTVTQKQGAIENLAALFERRDEAIAPNLFGNPNHAGELAGHAVWRVHVEQPPEPTASAGNAARGDGGVSDRAGHRAIGVDDELDREGVVEVPRQDGGGNAVPGAQQPA